MRGLFFFFSLLIFTYRQAPEPQVVLFDVLTLFLCHRLCERKNK